MGSNGESHNIVDFDLLTKTEAYIDFNDTNIE